MSTSTKKPLTIAITGMNAKPDNPGPGLPVARCLRLAYGNDIRIIGLGYDVLDAGLYLQGLCDVSYLLPYPSAGEQLLMERMQFIQSTESIDILIPCLDAELLSFSRLHHEFEALGIRMLIPDVAQLRDRNKDRLGELARNAGIRYPETKTITSANFFYQCHDDGWKYPMVVKGIFYDATVVHSADEGAQAFRHIAASWGYPVLVQRYVKGHEVNLTAIGDGKGNLLGSVMMRKQAVTDKGKAWSCVTVDNQQLQHDAQKLAHELQWAGPLEVEMLKEADGNYLLIEINPRFPAWIYLAAEAGCNLPEGLVKLILDTQPEFQKAKVGMMMIRYAQEIVIDLNTFESMSMHGCYAPQGKHGEQR
ncbi:MAG: ATP-grasp domain-containing protein [Mariprofundaceae bacterium]|nr:ATP-grasp domain-containing protein [Mariprofundaceae bacterium]